jgi:hypothetical protein
MRYSIILLALVLSITIIHDIRPYSVHSYANQHESFNTPSFASLEPGPSIGWSPEPYNTMIIDGAYTGQSQEIFEYRVWVNDSLGVDSVLFRFKWSDDEE